MSSIVEANVCDERQLELGFEARTRNSTDLEKSDRAFLRRREPREVAAGTRRIRVADLFCGCGGLSVGLREACCDLDLNFVSVWAADSDEGALEVYRRNFQPEEICDQPLEERLAGDLGEPLRKSEKDLKASVGPLDFLLAGPPCQGHSALNNRTRHEDERNRLYEKVGRFVDLVEPLHILIENVPTVVLDRDRSIYNTVEHLQDLGYSVDTGIVDLSKIGVPQRRKRHIVVASKSKRPTLRAWLKANEVAIRDVRWAMGDLVDTSENSLLNTPSVLSDENHERIAHLFEHDLYDLPNSERPDCHQDDEHTYKSMYGRLRWDEPAQTITTGFNSPGQGRYIHPSRHRTLTPHEAARLQFLPDDFDFSSVEYRSHLSRMIGNAVPPKLSWVIGRELLR